MKKFDFSMMEVFDTMIENNVASDCNDAGSCDAMSDCDGGSQCDDNA